MTNEERIEALTTLKEQARYYGDNTFIWSINIDSFNFVIESTIKALEQEPILDKLRAEITILQNRCYALTKGTMCAFCRYECEYKPESEG